MNISEVVKRTGILASTLRFYEQKGLITAISPQGVRRNFSNDIIDRLALISLGQAGGLSLDEIRSMLPQHGIGTLKIDRTLLLSKADKVDNMVKKLEAISQGLRHVANCPKESHMQCETFKELLKMATLNRQKQQK